MELNMEEIINKYSKLLLKDINTENMKKIIEFLKEKNCTFIEDILTDYLDLFSIEYHIFCKKYEEINKRYDNNFLECANNNLDLLEEFFN